MASKPKDITGQTFGLLTAIRISDERKSDRVMWECECACGNTVSVDGRNLRSGHSKSCGCAKGEFIAEGKRTHGQSSKDSTKHTGAYKSYRLMMSRCYTPNNNRYKNYGAQGVTVCDRWRGNFAAFYEDMGDRPKGYSLERKDWRLGYSKENCCWIPLKEQPKNTRKTVWLEVNGEVMIQQDAARVLGVGRSTISDWLRHKHRIPEGVDIKVVPK